MNRDELDALIAQRDAARAERDALRALLAEARGAIFADADVHDVRASIDAALRSEQ